ncbi:hypothetical protein F5Y09DRAFT_239288 [Xylaria sp. FL1042]|nr:hypothetical protein F5Y09DRAFT_239288 [Xylaria sp. FL1042]
MAAPTGLMTETLVDITITPLSPEPELQRGRKRRRDFFELGATAGSSGRPTLPSSESATFRGRCRYRSSSRYLDMSRPTSQHQHRMLAMGTNHTSNSIINNHPHPHPHQRNASASPSPSRRKMIRITQLARDRRPRSRSPSRSRSPPYAALGTALFAPRRRRQRTQSRSRPHVNLPMGLEMTSRDDDVKIAALEAVVLPVTTYGVPASSDEGSMAESGGRHGE